MPLTPPVAIHMTAALGRLAVMAGQIVSHTPPMVWALLAGLVALGLSQARERRVGLARATMLPLAMVALSLWGTASLYGHGPHLPLVLGAWLVPASAAFFAVARTAPARGTQFDPVAKVFVVPASWLPMLLIVGVFVLRYATNVALALHPELASDAGFCVSTTLVSAGFTGIFGGRAARLWQFAQRQGWASPSRSVA
jgi:hypothetical protein